MTSVNYQQYAPRHAYEMPPKPVPAQHEGGAEASMPSQAQVDSASSRQPMTAQQRGQFAAHKALVNSPSSTANTDPARLAQLSQENTQLREKLNQLVAQFSPVIMQLQKQVADLTQQLNTMKAPEKSGSPSNQSVSDSPEARQSRVSSEAPTRADGNTPVSGQDTPRNLEQLTAENDQLRETVGRLQTQFTAVVGKLQEQIQGLTQKMGGADTSASQTPADTSASKTDSDTPASRADSATSASKTGSDAPSDTGSTEQASSTRDATPSAQPTEPTAATRGVDDLLRENEQLRTRIDQMMSEFTQVITQLQQQIAQLSKQISAMAK